MKKNLLLFAIFLLPLIGMAQTTIFTDNFNRVSSGATTSALSSGGTPSVTYTSSTTSTGSGGTAAKSQLFQLSSTNYGLQIIPGSTTSYTSGGTYSSASIPSSSLFSSTLSGNSSDVQWTFHMKTYRNGGSLSGFTNSNYGGAVILASTTGNLAALQSSPAAGYVVTLERGATNTTINLKKFLNGIGFGTVTTATWTNASNSLTVTSATGIAVGYTISATGIPSGTTVTAISGNTLTMSANSTASGTAATISFTNSSQSTIIKGDTANSVVAPSLTATPTAWGSGSSAQTIWIAVKVVYTPSTNTWKLYWRDDSNGSTPTYTSDFSTGMNLCGFKADNTYTSSTYPMTNFGFLWNHASTNGSSNTFIVDNFSLAVNNPTVNNPSVNSLTGFTATNSEASAEQSFTISGQYLTNSIVATAPTGFEVSATSGGSASWGATATLTNAATVAATSIYVRLKSGLSDGSKSGNITIASDGATSTSSYTVALSGTVSSTPTLSTSTNSLTTYANTSAGSNSTSKSFSISGVNLPGSVVTITAPTNYTVSTDDVSYASSKTVAVSSGFASSTIYVKFSPTGSGVTSGNITISTQDMTDLTVAVSGNLKKFYFTSAGADISDLNNWSGTPDGTGTTRPSTTTITITGANGMTLGMDTIVLAAANSNIKVGLNITGSGIPANSKVTYYSSSALKMAISNAATLTDPNASFTLGSYFTNTLAADSISFVVLANATTTQNAFVMTGLGSKFVIGDPSYPGVTFTIANGYDFATNSVGVIDIPAANSGSNSFVIQNPGTPPALGLLHATSEVHYQATISIGTTANFGKLYVDGGFGLAITGMPTIQTGLYVGISSASTDTLTINSSSSYVVLFSGATCTIQGNFRTQRLPGALSFSVGTPGTGFGALQFKDAYNSSSPNFVLGTNCTFEYNRTASSTNTQAISYLPTGYQNLIISDGSGSTGVVTKTFAAGAHTVAGAFTINHVNPATSTISLGTATVTANGPVVLTKGPLLNSGNLTLGNSATITVTGGSFDAAPSFGTAVDLTYTGTTAITSGFEMPSSTSVLRNLTLNNAAGLTLASDATINNTLTLTSGKLSIAAGKTLTLPSATASISGAGSTKYIVTANDGTNIGKVKMTGFSSAKTLPIGTANYYLPVTLTPASSSDFEVSVFQGVTRNGALGGTNFLLEDKANLVDAIWTVNRTTGSGNCIMQLAWDVNLEGATFNTNPSDVALGISRYDGAIWSTFTKTSGTNASKSVTQTYSLFSPFMIGSASFTLPVTLTNISATVKSAGVELVWETANEDGIRQYVVEKSSNGIDFNAIGFVNASNNGKYIFTDGSASTGVFYYRLKIVSVGGEITYSKVMMVKTAAAVSVSVYPNPVANSITISGLSGKTSLKIINTAGVTLKQINTAANTLSLDVNDLKAGMYMIQAVDASGRVKTVSFVKM
jgi:hypothetical protein